MSLTAVMVYVDFDDNSENRIRAAADLAARFNALLIGVGAWPLRKSGPALETSSASAERDRLQTVMQRLDGLGQDFRTAAGKIVGQTEWRSFPHLPREVLGREARAADILVIGKEPLPGDIYRTYDPGTVILEAGRPVLVLPHDSQRLDISRVLIGWKDTREARRAVRDALPLLKRAQKVAIAVANPQPALPSGIDEQVADVRGYLGRHGVSLDQEIETVAGENDGAILLELAGDYKADLIVAGAYGRARLSEWMFGGVTRHLLTTSTIPCLFSN